MYKCDGGIDSSSDVDVSVSVVEGSTTVCFGVTVTLFGIVNRFLTVLKKRDILVNILRISVGDDAFVSVDCIY